MGIDSKGRQGVVNVICDRGVFLVEARGFVFLVDVRDFVELSWRKCREIDEGLD